MRQGQPATVRVQGLGDAAFKGRVIQVGPQVDEKTRTLPVRVAVRNPRSRPTATSRSGRACSPPWRSRRRAGSGVRASCPVRRHPDPRRPARRLRRDAAQRGAAFQRRPVKLGARDGDVVEVVEGLSAGERVVVANAYLLKSEFERSKISQGHAH